MTEYIPTQHAIGDKFTFCGQSLDLIQLQLNDDNVKAAFYSIDDNGNYTHLYVSLGLNVGGHLYNWHKVVLENLPVIIRKENNHLVAFFPTLIADVYGKYYTCYSQLDSHGSYHPEYVDEHTSFATKQEIETMLAELRRLGYYNLTLHDKTYFKEYSI